ALVAAWLAEFGGRPLAEPPRIDWKAPAQLTSLALPVEDGGAVEGGTDRPSADVRPTQDRTDWDDRRGRHRTGTGRTPQGERADDPGHDRPDGNGGHGTDPARSDDRSDDRGDKPAKATLDTRGGREARSDRSGGDPAAGGAVAGSGSGRRAVD